MLPHLLRYSGYVEKNMFANYNAINGSKNICVENTEVQGTVVLPDSPHTSQHVSLPSSSQSSSSTNYHSRRTSCGFFNWRPKCLDRFNKPSCLLICLCIFSFTLGECFYVNFSHYF